jgi:hypothetical protein
VVQMGSSRGLLGVPGMSRRWQRRRPGSLHAGLPVSAKKTRGFLTLGFSGRFENRTHFALFGKSNLF